MKWTFLLCNVLFVLTYCQGQNNQKTILENVSTNIDLTILSSLLVNSTSEEIKNILASKQQYTLFAPENLALSVANINVLDPIATGNFLKYHIIQGIVKTSDLKVTPLLSTLLSDTSLVNLPNGKSQVLSIHNVNDSVRIANASIIKAGLEASNGIIHIIDKVLPIPDKPSQLISTTNTRTFSDILIKTNIAGLIDSLKGVTVFVPVESAFEAFKVDTLNETALLDLIRFHVISPAVVYSTEFTKTQKYSTLQSKPLSFKIQNGASFVNGVEIITTNIIANNGVIHLISEVLSPLIDYNATLPYTPSQNSTGLDNPIPDMTGYPNRPSIGLLNMTTKHATFPFTTLLQLALLTYYILV